MHALGVVVGTNKYGNYVKLTVQGAGASVDVFLVVP